MRTLFKEGKSYIADFKPSVKPNREPDFISYSYRKFRAYEPDDFPEDQDFEILLEPDETDGYFLLQTKKVSSRYWYQDGGCYRESDHWGECGKSVFLLDGKYDKSYIAKTGFCPRDGFACAKKYKAQKRLMELRTNWSIGRKIKKESRAYNLKKKRYLIDCLPLFESVIDEIKKISDEAQNNPAFNDGYKKSFRTIVSDIQYVREQGLEELFTYMCNKIRHDHLRHTVNTWGCDFGKIYTGYFNL